MRKGHGVELANTATGVTYRLRFEAGTTAAPTVIAIQPSSTTPQSRRFGEGESELMNPLQRKANSVEMNRTIIATPRAGSAVCGVPNS